MDKREAIQTGIFKNNLFPQTCGEPTTVYLGAAILFSFPIPGICA